MLSRTCNLTNASVKSVRAGPFRPARCSKVSYTARRAAATEVESLTPEAVEHIKETDEPEIQPTMQQIGRLVSTLVNDTSILELELQVGSFELKVRRSMSSGAAAAVPVAAAVPAAAAPAAAPVQHMPGPLRSMDGSFPLALTATMEDSIEESIDESLVVVNSPKVGILRRAKYAGGKRVSKGPMIKEGDQVKKGQTLAFVEQLGTFVAVEAPQAGEIVKFLVDEGAAVEYQQEVIEIAPFFGGHIIGDKKHA